MNLLFFYSLFLAGLSLLVPILSNSVIFRVADSNARVASENMYKSSYFLYYADGKVYSFPDAVTFDAILRDAQYNVTVFPTSVGKMLLQSNPKPKMLPSLTPHGSNWEENLRLKIARASIHERNDFVDMKSVIELPRKINPSFVFFNKRVLVCWMEDHRLGFGWFDKENQRLDESIEYLGLGGEAHRFPFTNYNQSQEDCRLLRLSDQSIFVSFVTTQVVGPNRMQSTYCYSFLRYNTSTKLLDLSRVVTFDNELDTQQKNWMPFEYNRSVHLYHTIAPYPRIYRLRGHTQDGLAVTEEIPINAFVSQTGVHSSLPMKWFRYEKPWKTRFGEELHGGTPAIRVTPELYLFFFHATDYRQHPWTLYTGAATFCANNINLIHSMSSYPIARPEFYRGKAFNKRVSYIVFPIGLEVNLYNKEYVTVSLGVQDAHGVMLNMKLQPLLDSLTIVHDCDARDVVLAAQAEDKEAAQG